MDSTSCFFAGALAEYLLLSVLVVISIGIAARVRTMRAKRHTVAMHV